MPTNKVELDSSASGIISPKELKIILDGNDYIEFTAKDSDFTVIFDNKDNFFADDFSEWKVKISKGNTVKSPKISDKFDEDKEYKVSSTNVVDSPGKIIIGT